ncbi:sensor histidine kinase [Extibacter muris]|uniref:histidine kinase n=1 Tax=Extibacter muris TaxID=1796622 RepID=A0A4R4FBF9_9FIRM|nr:HAMP domain-containing sensor histidine kinase [Extibacter muris]MCU0079112.1 HAMP domain-containing histidine kinase [Extibacter muris]TDA20912.1 HAMP domain-containing histidine kinase [Extibacter muris]
MWYVWAGSITFLTGILIAVFFWEKERKTIRQLQKMLDHAIAGKALDVQLDESKTATIENDMWRYICDKEVFEQNVRREKMQIQSKISDISHQAVIPISNIILYSQLAEEEIRTRDREKSCVLEEMAAIQEQVEKLDFLIETLVKLSRTETGMIHVNKKYQLLQPILDTIRIQFQEKAEKKGVQLLIENTGESAVFDLKWTIEAVANVVDNGIKYTKSGGTVKIHVESYSSLVRMDVTDDGIGISEMEQASIFHRFYRSEMVSEEPGVGIGLYLAREVMKTQDGYIKVSSKIGEGSRFSLFFLKNEISQN